MPDLAPGQLWREVDPRTKRLIVIRRVDDRYATIVSCDANGNRLAGSRETVAQLHRFDGRRGGYELVTHPVATP